jgi:hypothetical protein
MESRMALTRMTDQNGALRQLGYQKQGQPDEKGEFSHGTQGVASK